MAETFHRCTLFHKTKLTILFLTQCSAYIDGTLRYTDNQHHFYSGLCIDYMVNERFESFQLESIHWKCSSLCPVNCCIKNLHKLLMVRSLAIAYDKQALTLPPGMAVRFHVRAISLVWPEAELFR